MNSNQSWYKYNYRAIIFPNLHFESRWVAERQRKKNAHKLLFAYSVYCGVNLCFDSSVHTHTHTHTSTYVVDNCDRFRFWTGLVEFRKLSWNSIFFFLLPTYQTIWNHATPDVVCILYTIHRIYVDILEFSPRWYQTKKNLKTKTKLFFFSCIFFSFIY